ncbi:MAG: HD domain-containing protein [Planctomycetes bacterium]|nr:HD domain-containing protein [Planctomycetota bacterium]
MIDTSINIFSPAQRHSLENFAGRIINFNVNTFVFDTEMNCALEQQTEHFKSDIERIRQTAEKVLKDESETVQVFGGEARLLSICLKEDNKFIAVAVIDTAALYNGPNEELARQCSMLGLDYSLIEDAVRESSRDYQYLTDILESFSREFRTFSKSVRHLEMVSVELTQTYEELMLLYNMSKNMKVTQTIATFLQLACDQVTRSVNVEGIAIFLEKYLEGGKRLVLSAGSGLVNIDEYLADVLYVRLSDELKNGADALLDSNVSSSFKHDWPMAINSIIAAPLHGNSGLMGMMVATNIIDKPDFDTIDVKLFNSVANLCATFIENDRLFSDLKELFIGSLKTLSNSIDAKDQYTRGHSERVAFISRWIAEQMSERQPIDEDYIHKIYLAGMLHDIGKIGINEAVLLKKGKLTEDDFEMIKTHPRIGASIMADIKQLRELVPGILHHHERIDGKGYPDGLEGDRIPLMGKIIGLADAFDAMTSKRVYRDAMSIARASKEIEDNLGTQFDEKIGRIFLDSDIHKLWNIIQDGFIENWDYSNFSEYGTKAVGSLIR